MFTKGYLEQSGTSTMELFSLLLNQILKTYLIELPFGSVFCLTHPFMKKLATVKSLLLTIK